MKFKFNNVVAAVALAVASTGANAAFSSFDSGNSNFIFSAWDIQADAGYAIGFDGATLNGLVGASRFDDENSAPGANSGTPIVISPFSGGIFFDTALTGFNLSGSNVRWSLAAYDNENEKRLVVSQNAGVGAFSGTADKVGGAATSYANLSALSSGAFQNSTSADTDSGLFPAAEAFTGQTVGGRFSNVSSALGASANLFYMEQMTIDPELANQTAFFQQLTAGGQTIFARTYQLTEGGPWRFQIGATEVAAIPEPESYAMMLAGLALMGGVARRRNNKA